MRRREFITLLGGAMTLWPFAVPAQQAAKIPTIGFLSGGSPGSPFIDAFESGLRDLGWVKGKNIAIEYRYAEGKAELLPNLAADLVRMRVDLIVAPGPPARHARDATSTIPVVFLLGADPVAFSLVDSFERRDPDQIEKAFADMASAQMNGLIFIHSPMFAARRAARIDIDLVAKHKLRAIYEWGVYADAGGLMSYGANLLDEYRRAAPYVVKILKGAKPADLPIEQPTNFELVINLKTAKALDLAIPSSLRMHADRLIE
jgi:putative ABC transport system substrate-binding protein